MAKKVGERRKDELCLSTVARAEAGWGLPLLLEVLVGEPTRSLDLTHILCFTFAFCRFTFD